MGRRVRRAGRARDGGRGGRASSSFRRSFSISQSKPSWAFSSSQAVIHSSMSAFSTSSRSFSSFVWTTSAFFSMTDRATRRGASGDTAGAMKGRTDSSWHTTSASHRPARAGATIAAPTSSLSQPEFKACHK